MSLAPVAGSAPRWATTSELEPAATSTDAVTGVSPATLNDTTCAPADSVSGPTIVFGVAAACTTSPSTVRSADEPGDRVHDVDLTRGRRCASRRAGRGPAEHRDEDRAGQG